MATETIKAAISEVSNSAGTLTNVSGGIIGKDSANTSSSIRFTFSKGTTSYMYLGFDLSAIPAGAEIDSVTCNVRFLIEHTGVTALAALYAGSTKKTGDTGMANSAATLYTLSGGTWTRDEIISCRLGISCLSNNSTASRRASQAYGADLTVTYTYHSEKFMLKLGGKYNDIARTFKNVNGVWVEVDDLSTAVDTSKKLVNGGEITS